MENISLTELNFFVEKGAIDDSLFASAFEYFDIKSIKYFN